MKLFNYEGIDSRTDGKAHEGNMVFVGKYALLQALDYCYTHGLDSKTRCDCDADAAHWIAESYLHLYSMLYLNNLFTPSETDVLIVPFSNVQKTRHDHPHNRIYAYTESLDEVEQLVDYIFQEQIECSYAPMDWDRISALKGVGFRAGAARPNEKCGVQRIELDRCDTCHWTTVLFSDYATNLVRVTCPEDNAILFTLRVEQDDTPWTWSLCEGQDYLPKWLRDVCTRYINICTPAILEITPDTTAQRPKPVLEKSEFFYSHLNPYVISVAYEGCITDIDVSTLDKSSDPDTIQLAKKGLHDCAPCGTSALCDFIVALSEQDRWSFSHDGSKLIATMAYDCVDIHVVITYDKDTHAINISQPNIELVPSYILNLFHDEIRALMKPHIDIKQ